MFRFLKSTVMSESEPKPDTSSVSTCDSNSGSSGKTSGEEVPKAVQRRVLALTKLLEPMYDVMSRYGNSSNDCPELFGPIFEKRRRIVTGEYEPTDEDLPHNQQMAAVVDTDIVGIPNFWLKVLSASVPYGGRIRDTDRPVLKHLVDIEHHLNKKRNQFTVEFHFSANEYFTNEVLTRRLFILKDADLECTESCSCRAIRCVSTRILWNDGKDVTKMDELDAIGEQPKESFFDSFFWMSSSPLDEKQESRLKRDFEEHKDLSHDIIPWAVMHFIGEAAIARQLNHQSDD